MASTTILLQGSNKGHWVEELRSLDCWMGSRRSTRRHWKHEQIQWEWNGQSKTEQSQPWDSRQSPVRSLWMSLSSRFHFALHQIFNQQKTIWISTCQSFMFHHLAHSFISRTTPFRRFHATKSCIREKFNFVVVLSSLRAFNDFVPPSDLSWDSVKRWNFSNDWIAQKMKCEKLFHGLIKIIWLTFFLRSFKRPFITCLLEDCSKEAMLGTPHCQDHVLMDGKEQHLIRQCSFLFPHGEQCRVPVHDVMATIAVCNEHQSAVSSTKT